MTAPAFRFAPSPNGELHLGHAYSALLNAEMVRQAQGRFLLRIEDTDTSRCKPHYASAILADLAWLGLQWEQPVRVQSAHFADYDANLAHLRALDKIYPCFCSRKQAAARGLATRDPDGQPHYGGTCRTLSAKDAAARIAAGAQFGWRLAMDRCDDPRAAPWGDVMIAKRHVGSYYHIAVVTDDHLQAITHVVRGRDMEPATPLHLLLQRLLGYSSPVYIHHDLILDEHGRKLSKSIKSRSLAALRSEGLTPADIRRRLGFG